MNLGNSLNKLILSDDLIVAYTYVGDETAPDSFPNKGEGYAIKSVTCNGMDTEWNNTTWSLTFSNVTGKNITCNFEIDDTIIASEYIMTLTKTNTNELRIDEHVSTGQQNFAVTEYRYYGKTPNNYVWFNDELWRIIGVMDVDDGSKGNDLTGNIDKIIKIIRNEVILSLPWYHPSNYNGGYGINEWSQSQLMNLLNTGDYYNKTNNYINTGLTNSAKEMIGNAKWYLGAGPEIYDALTTNDMYILERGKNNGKICTQGTAFCNDSIPRTTLWQGKVGVINPSDYGYSANISMCYSIPLSSFNTNACNESTWLYDGENNYWTLNSHQYSGNAVDVFLIRSNGTLNVDHAYNSNSTKPVVYLLPDIKIIDGQGTDKQPYILEK